MKNEDRIVDLLSDSLKRQDQMIEQMSGMNERLDVHENLLGRIVTVLEKQTDQLASIERKLDDLADLRERIKRIEKHVGLD